MQELLRIKPLSEGKKATILRQKLTELSEERRVAELSFIFLYPGRLDWGTEGQTVFHPPLGGRIVSMAPDISMGRRRVKAILAEVTKPSDRSIIFAQIGLGAVDITEDDQIVVDCRKLSSPTGIARRMFPPHYFMNP